MNPRLEKATDPRLARCEADLSACVQTVFRRCPMLAGFAVCEGAIQLADMTCHPAQSAEVLEDMREYITNVLIELADDEPETAFLMSGRTFPRTTH
jgi:hypothetical protein